MAQALLFTTWIGVALVAVLTLGVVIPTVARIRFLTAIEELRDDVVDRIIAGELPEDDPAVQEFITVQEAFLRESRELTISRLSAFDRVAQRVEMPPLRRPSYNRLDANHRRLIHDLEGRSKAALQHYIVWGSARGYLTVAAGRLGLLRAAVVTLRFVARLLQRGTGASTSRIPEPSEPEELAERTYSEVQKQNRRATPVARRDLHKHFRMPHVLPGR